MYDVIDRLEGVTDLLNRWSVRYAGNPYGAPIWTGTLHQKGMLGEGSLGMRMKMGRTGAETQIVSSQTH